MADRRLREGYTTRIIGLGNDFRGDDGLGLYVARTLKRSVPLHTTVFEVSDVAGGLLDAMNGADSVIIVDAMSSGGIPGTILRFDANRQAIPSTSFRTSTHAMNVTDVILLARVLDTLAPKCCVYGIEGADFTMGASISPSVRAAADTVVREIAESVDASVV